MNSEQGRIVGQVANNARSAVLPAIADNLVYALRSEGFAVAHVGLARDALSAFARDGADLVVLDIGVPDGHGLDVYRSLRQLSEVPVMFLTARASELDRVLGLELGAAGRCVRHGAARRLATPALWRRLFATRTQHPRQRLQCALEHHLPGAQGAAAAQRTPRARRTRRARG